MLLMKLILAVTTAFAVVHAIERPQRSAARYLRRKSINETVSSVCAQSPSWKSTTAAWNEADTDSKLAVFLKNLTTGDRTPFDQALGNRYGAHYPGFKCGINVISSCPLPACSSYELNPTDRWAYFATLATVNLNTKFNILHQAISNGQLDYLGLTDDLADNFFAWKDPIFIGDAVAFWVVAATTILFSAVTLGAFAPVTTFGVAGIGTMLGAATHQTTMAMRPSEGLIRGQGISFLKKSATELGQSGRYAMEAWANNTFAGRADSQGHTIVDYFQGGGLLKSDDMPSSAAAEQYYKSVMVAKTVNWQWKSRANFLMFASTGNANAQVGPNATRYYSDQKKGVYNLYNFDTGKLQAPDGLNLLNDTAYGISPWQLTRSSARAWEFAGNNYNDTIALSRIQESFRSNGGLNPFRDGPGWEGMFTFPVCDVGTHIEWLTDYGGSGLPCCCGRDCVDTKDFVRAANLNTSQALLAGCRALLKDTLINFDRIDYGIAAPASTFKDKWNNLWSTGQKAGISIGLIFAGAAAFVVLAGIVGLVVSGCS